MKTLFLLLSLLTEPNEIRSVIQSCFTSAVVSVGVFFVLGCYQAIRRSSLRRNSGTASGA